ncbi:MULTISPECIES: histidine phosphatase family protein [unclassified Breznakia]|uniref:histidine phosphatase family protein n=1 Tax=unclassified Breznakia TaxID=2623764 RepID=UPI0024746BC5|nr:MULTISPECIES: histidine phosphatase family protein [unclassified Breznakia]MDH6366003.1 broad specificity phosphatase PhoE [Breznakia sp. PH1-1]MDH6403065.1 broad specificity phosphatase PhoE [Breznakia sp. PF1-11]MDH6410774.1 broad specificity phosphatase PhoE [Breznakia sp. PFB1-11]MDH6413169.1 broad specificity phosphatase PhoE [Breznakia sp. PFB1-14]MDH6415537.1 broad specificity phosphatase PhoE [Breznakia sp. PFB1-4]
MAKTLYFMRHGQTLFNVLHLKQGWSDSPLTTLGKNQAIIAGRYFKEHDIVFDHAYSSTSERASDTLELVSKQAYQRVRGLKEWNFGRLEGSNDVVDPKPPYGDFFVQYGGEDEMEFRKRLMDTVTNIMDQEDHQQVLMVSHGAACAQLYRANEAYAKTKITYPIPNCAILRFTYEDGKLMFEEMISHDFRELDV